MKPVLRDDIVFSQMSGAKPRKIIMPALIFFLCISTFLNSASVFAAGCTPQSAVLCAAVDDESWISINGTQIGFFGYVNWDQTGIYPTCITLSGAQLALLQPAGNLIAVRTLNTNANEIWASWSLDITCVGATHAMVSSDSGDPISMFHDSSPCPADTPVANGGLQWTDPLYNQGSSGLSWTAPTIVTGQKWGKRLWDPQTGDLLPAIGYSTTSLAAAGDCKQLFFRQPFSLTIDPTPVPPAFTIVKSGSPLTGLVGSQDINFTLRVCNTGGGTFGNPVQVRDVWTGTEWRYNGPYGSWTDTIQGQIDQLNSGTNATWNFLGGLQGGNQCYNLTYTLRADNPVAYCTTWTNTGSIWYLSTQRGQSAVNFSSNCPPPPVFNFTKTVSPSTVVTMGSTYFFNLQFCNTGGAAWDNTKDLVLTDDFSGTGTDDWQFQGPYYIGNPTAGIYSISLSQAGKVITAAVDFTTPGFTGCYTIPIQMLKTSNGTIQACTWTNLGRAQYLASPVMNSNVVLNSVCTTPTFTVTRTRTYTPTYTRTPSPTNTPTPPISPTFTRTPTPTFTRTITPTYTRTPTPTFTRTMTPTPTFTFTQLTPTFTVTVTRTPTPTFTRTPTPTSTPTRTPTPTYTITQVTPTFTVTVTRTPTPTYTRTPTPTFTPSRTPTPTYTITQVTSTFTITVTRTPTPTFTRTPTPTSTYTVTPTPTFTITTSATYTRTPTPTFTITRSPTPTYTRTATPTHTWTVTVTLTYTVTPSITITTQNTPTVTPTITPTRTPTPTFTVTQSPTPTFTRSSTPTHTRTVTVTFTFTMTPSVTITSVNTPTVTPTITPTRTATPTFTITQSPTPTFTRTPTPTHTRTVTVTFTFTMTPSVTITSINTPTVTPTITPTRTATPTFTITQSPTPTYTRTPTPTHTRTVTVTFTFTMTPSVTITSVNTPTVTPTITPTRTPTPTFTITQSPTPTFTRTETATYTLTRTPTATFTATPTYSVTSLNTPTVTRTITPTFTDTSTFTATRTVTNTYTYTATPTITNTTLDTPTYTSTRTQTFTRTETPTFTITPTYTVTRTYTSTVTETSMNSPTNTPTDSPTQTVTRTATDTRTPTPTYTDTNVFTFTRTMTVSMTATDTRTPSPTFTETNTFTFTRTATDTRTETQTSTFTSTATDTRTQTVTMTATSTRTASPSMTETNTYTFTRTATDTRTASPTFTETNSYTFTRTATDTRTASPTFTETNTYTYTRTVTNTMTHTPTRTETQSSTYTMTVTMTRTMTLTRTYTFTRTASPTATNTPFYSPTRTATRTITPSPTQTFTRTSTGTSTMSRTISPTVTITLTATETPLVYPYLLVIEAYNEAGEKVKVIVNTKINTEISGFDTMVGNTVTAVFNPSETDLTLRFPGIWTDTILNVPYVDFSWDGKNANSQDVSQGVYYIKVMVTDNYGHMNTIVKEVQLLRTEEFVRVSIYNTSGEVVRRIEQGVVPGTQLSLETEDVFYINSGNNSTTIKLGGAGTMQWDGKNSLGSLVASGIYEVRVEVKDNTGYTVSSSRTITVLNEISGALLSDVKAYPNPSVLDDYSAAVMRLEWQSAAIGKITIRIYNVAGELVDRITGRIENLGADWDMQSASGQRLAAGFYPAVITAESQQGVTERLAVKLVIIRK